MYVSGYRCMWVVAMFDLPVRTKAERKAYAAFRKCLLTFGFRKMQYSVYIRSCASSEHADMHIHRIRGVLPDEGEVRIITVTDKQFERMRVFFGKRGRPPEKPPQQLELF